ncbi:threonine/serine dehydratase [Acidobacteriota bacterium]
MITLSHIRAAADSLPKELVYTPCLKSDELSRITGGTILLKAENLQPTGAYKVRAASHILSGLAGREKAVAISSSGNFAKAFAYMGRQYQVPIVTVMMKRTEAVKVNAVRALGAQVVFCEDRHQARWETLDALEKEGKVHTINTYESPDVLAGHGTIGLEIMQQASELDIVLVPVSSGGLIAGVATALKEINPRVKIIGIQPELSRAAYVSLQEGRPVNVPESRSICDALVATRPGELPFQHIQKYVDEIKLVPDEAVKRAVHLLARSNGLVVEPSGAVGAAILLERGIDVRNKRALLILSGGNIAPKTLAGILEEMDR